MFKVKHYNLPFDHFWEYYKQRPSYAGKCLVLINNLLTVDAKLKPLPKHCYVYAYSLWIIPLMDMVLLMYTY